MGNPLVLKTLSLDIEKPQGFLSKMLNMLHTKITILEILIEDTCGSTKFLNKKKF